MYTRKVPHFGGHSKELGPPTQVFSVFCPFIRLFTNFSFQSIWSERRVSNPQPPAWKAGALPIELLSLNLTLNHKFTIDKCKYSSGDRRIRTSEVETTDLQSVPFGHSGISPFYKKSRRRDSNPRPTDYKSVALPAELLRLIILILKNVPFYWGCKFTNNFGCCKKKYNFFWFFSKIIISSSFVNLKKKENPSFLDNL